MYKITTFKELYLAHKPSQPIFCDTETIGFYGVIRLAQFYQAGWDTVRIIEYPDTKELQQFMIDNVVVFHNGHYDLSTIDTQLNDHVDYGIWHDTMYLGRLALFRNQEGQSFDTMLTYILGYNPYDELGDKKELQKSNWGAETITDLQYRYAAYDVYYMVHLWDIVKGAKNELSYKLDMLSVNYALDFQRNGMPVERDKAKLRQDQNLAEVQKYGFDFNINSWQQVRPKINYHESDGLALSCLALQGNTLAGDIKKAKSLLKQNSFIKKFNADRVYGYFSPSTKSGRFSCNDQNLQQIPRSLKNLFGYKKEAGKVLVYADFAQLELRAGCAIIDESKMAEIFRSGADMHNYTAEFIFGNDFTKTHRQIAKTANFNLLYGGGTGKGSAALEEILADTSEPLKKKIGMFSNILLKQANLFLPNDEAGQMKRQWLNLWTGIKKWHENSATLWQMGENESTPLGRKYVAKLLTDFLNIKVQGHGADVAKLAMHYQMQADLPKSAKLLNFIHDSYIWECDDDPEEYEKLAHIVADSMVEAWFEMSKLTQITDLPMPTTCLVGRNWGEIEYGENILYEYTNEGLK